MKATTFALAVFAGQALAQKTFTNPSPPPANSTEAVCAQASVQLFNKCYDGRQDKFTVDAELHARCKQDSEDAKKKCLEAKLIGDEIVDSDDVREKKKKAECIIVGNRELARCKKNMFVPEKPLAPGEKKDTTYDCVNKANAAEKACLSGEQPAQPAQPAEDGEQPADECEEAEQPTPKPVDEYCAERAAQSVIQFDKQYCLDAFKRCGHKGTYVDDNTKARECADKIIKDKPWHKKPTGSQPSAGTEPTPVAARV